MARKKKQRGRIRAKRRERKEQLRRALEVMSKGFTDLLPDEVNPFEHTQVARNADAATVVKMQRRFSSDTRRRNTFAERYGITRGYDTLIDLYSNPLYLQLKERGMITSSQVRELVTMYDENIDAAVVENALTKFINELNLPTYVSIESIQDALDAGFNIEDAVEYAELMAQDVQTDVSGETAFTDLIGIIEENLRTIRRNNGQI